MVGKLKEDLMATIKELYDLCKKKQEAGEKIRVYLNQINETVRKKRK